MVDHLYRWLDKNYLKRNYLFRYRLVKVFLNMYLPWYYRLSRKKRLDSKSNVVVSLTTFPARISKVHLVIEGIFRQTVMPSRVVLYLSRLQFSSFEVLPRKLKRLVKEGYLDIKFVDHDYKPHKKYFYAIKEFPNHVLITIDDDIFYPEILLEKLTNTYNRHHQSVCCYNASYIPVTKDGVAAYSDWKSVSESEVEDLCICPIGCGSVLYPPKCFDNSILLDEKLFMELCPNADDLWLKMNAVMMGVKTVKCAYYQNFVFVDVVIPNNQRLCSANVGKNENDKQLANILNVFPEVIRILEGKIIRRENKKE